jgi:SUMO ligase MMS21 Smc5/6 complex component
MNNMLIVFPIEFLHNNHCIQDQEHVTSQSISDLSISYDLEKTVCSFLLHAFQNTNNITCIIVLQISLHVCEAGSHYLREQL